MNPTPDNKASRQTALLFSDRPLSGRMKLADWESTEATTMADKKTTKMLHGLTAETGAKMLFMTRKSHRWSNFGSFSGCSGLPMRLIWLTDGFLSWRADSERSEGVTA